MIDAAASKRLEGTSLLKDWEVLSEKVSRASAQRNALAHGMWLIEGSTSLGTARNTVQPHPRKIIRKAKRVFDVQALAKVNEEFNSLEGNCAVFSAALRKYLHESTNSAA